MMHSTRSQTLLILMLFVMAITFGCAPGFKSLHKATPLLLAEGSSDSLLIRYSYQPFTSSPKFATRAANDQLAAFYVEITNLSNSPIEIQPSSFEMRSKKKKKKKKKRSPESTETLSEMYRSTSGAYMLWSLLFVSISTEDSFIPIPIGVPIGIGQMARSNNYNKKMKAEFDQKGFAETLIQPGGTAAGHLYFRFLSDHKWTFNFDYNMMNETQRGVLEISRSAMAPLILDWRRKRLNPVH